MSNLNSDVLLGVKGADMSVTWSQDASANHLLLVDDDVDTRELIAESLRHAGYDVEEAGDGRDALAAIMRECPSLLITDCNMPNMTGNELIEQLARDERLCLLPAIVISARKHPPMPANVIAFLAKPFRMAQLQAAVRDGLATSLEDSVKPGGR